VRLAVPRLHALLEPAAHLVASDIAAAAGASPPVGTMPADTEDAGQQQAAEEGQGRETRIVGCDSDGDSAADGDESEQGAGWTEVHGDLLMTPVDMSITIVASCEDRVNAVRRSCAAEGPLI
jgi:hypothetical protein